MTQHLKIWLHNNPHTRKSEAKPHSDAILQQLLQISLNSSLPIKILKNGNGKPYCQEAVYFSHSNSRKLYAYVVSVQSDVAIDLEYIKPGRDVMKLAHRYFHDDESHYLEALPADQRLTAFYQLWTEKEAWCKLDGGNLWSYLNRSLLNKQGIKTQQGDTIRFTPITAVRGFAGSVACTAQIDQYWINNIG